MLPIFDPPGILLNKPFIKGHPAMTIHSVMAYAADGAMEKLQRAGSASTRFTIDWIARTVAKIAHSYSVAELGINGFQPLLTDIIIGQAFEYGHYIGNGMLHQQNSATEELHTLSKYWDGELLVITVGLYTRFQGGVTYLAVSGRRKP